jgi:hypothetical protein
MKGTLATKSRKNSPLRYLKAILAGLKINLLSFSKAVIKVINMSPIKIASNDNSKV